MNFKETDEIIASKIEKLISIYDIIDDFDMIIFDVWGVLIEANEPYKNVVDVFNKISKIKEVKIISNTPSLSNHTAEKLKKFGFNITGEQITTSGLVAKKIIENSEKYFSKKYFKAYFLSNFSTDFPNYIENFLIDDIEKADAVIINLYADSESQLNEYKKLITDIYFKSKILFICINPDKIITNGYNKARFCPGYFCDIYKNLGGKVYYTGKPYKEIFNISLKNFQNIDKSKILMIGDTLDTDILGGKNSYLKTALVNTGNSQIYSNQIDELNKFCDQSKIFPDYFISLGA